MKRQFLVAGMLAALGPLAAVGFAAQSASSNGNAKNLSSSDMAFARKAAEGGLAEVKLGELAEKNGGTQQVKDFGQRMVQDHTRLNGELTLDAAKENIQLPNEMSSTDQNTYNSLSKLSGAAFDRAYSRDMVSDHQKDISDFQKEAKDGRNSTLKDFAASATPVLQQHLTLAREMQNGTSQSSSKKTNSANRPS